MTAEPVPECINGYVGVGENTVIIERISGKKKISPFVLEPEPFLLQKTFFRSWDKGLARLAVAGTTVGCKDILFTLPVQVQGKIGKGEQQGEG